MKLNLDVLRLSQSLAAHAADRQNLIARNVANADTPGYRARDLVPFSDLYGADASRGVEMKTTRAGHLDDGQGIARHRVVETRVLGAESPNGNTVSLEDQTMRSVEARQSHDLALGVYSKSLDILRLAVRGTR